VPAFLCSVAQTKAAMGGTLLHRRRSRRQKRFRSLYFRASRGGSRRTSPNCRSCWAAIGRGECDDSKRGGSPALAYCHVSATIAPSESCVFLIVCWSIAIWIYFYYLPKTWKAREISPRSFGHIARIATANNVAQSLPGRRSSKSSVIADGHTPTRCYKKTETFKIL